mmetsp:Transcript_14179/g.13705  ORF Transcript_14179/g.13705 Transcript_14179/m.13705 type:complete len:1264 (-) Transcript_14179:244-4035(-)|eukprot:CAMPEP_0119040392 /NCGR_PEP_ID=MMETSP1177-20130426/10308_1 /TAXON_ID=2985 /ORGANISM="Ochromonas sp, Strain CCMP1899" /LENGTH=1263 /DNA_ID=CAMNT_0007005401 /DNA_START=97 /DNA_END=3888 /DNA_ORIENTATION=+
MTRKASSGTEGSEAEVTVEVKAAQLEQYLSSIKETLSKHEEDSKLVRILSQKLDLCMLDIDVIRDSFYRQKSQIAEQNTTQSYANTIQFLRAELEALKTVTRKIDLNQATDRMVFGQIIELQREVRMMKKRESEGSGREKSEQKKTKFKKDKKIVPIHNSDVTPPTDEMIEQEVGRESHVKLSRMSFNSSLDALSTSKTSTSEEASNIATGISPGKRLNSIMKDNSKSFGRKEVTYDKEEYNSSDKDDDKENNSPNKSYSSKWKSRKISMLTRNRRRNIGDSDSDNSDDKNGPGYNSEFDEIVRGMDKHQTAIASIEQHLDVLQKKQVANVLRDEITAIAKLKKQKSKKIANGTEILSNVFKRITLKSIKVYFLLWDSKVQHKIAIIPRELPKRIVNFNEIKSSVSELPKKPVKLSNGVKLNNDSDDSRQNKYLEGFERKRKGNIEGEKIDWKEREKQKNAVIVEDIKPDTSYHDKLIDIATSVTKVNWLAVILRPRFQHWKARTLMEREADYQDERKGESRDIAEALKQAQMTIIRPIAKGWFLLSYPELRQYYQRWRRCTVWSRLKMEGYIEGGSESNLTEISTCVFEDLENEEYQIYIAKFATMLMKLTDQPEITSDIAAYQLVLRILFKAISLRISHADTKIEEDLKKNIEKMSSQQLNQQDEIQKLLNFISRIDTKIAQSRNAANLAFDDYKNNVSKMIESSVGNAAEILNFKQGAMLVKLRDMGTKIDFWALQAQESEERLVRTEFKSEKLLISYGEQLSQLVALENGHLEYMKERVIWNRDMKNVSLTANTTQEKFLEFNRWRMGYETIVKSEINVVKGSCNELRETMDQIGIKSDNRRVLIRKLEGRMVILEQVLQVISPVIPSAKELISICFEFENDILHLNQNLNIHTINVNMIIDIAISEKITRFATRLALHIATTANLAALCVAISEPSIQTSVNNSNLTGTTVIAEEVASRRDQLLHEFHSQFVLILKAESSSNPGISRCEARVVFYHRFISALELSMSIHAYMMVELPAAIGRSKALSQSQSDKLLPTMMSSYRNDNGIANKKDDSSSSSCLTCNQPLKDKYGLKKRKGQLSFNSLPILLSAFEEEMSVLSLRKKNEKNDKLALQSIQMAKASRTAFLSDTYGRKDNGTLPRHASDSKLITEEHMLSIRPIIGKESRISGFSNMNSSQTSFNNMNSESIHAALANSRDDNAPASNIDNVPDDNQSEYPRRESNPNPSTGNQSIRQLLKDRSQSAALADSHSDDIIDDNV